MVRGSNWAGEQVRVLVQARLHGKIEVFGFAQPEVDLLCRLGTTSWVISRGRTTMLLGYRQGVLLGAVMPVLYPRHEAWLDRWLLLGAMPFYRVTR
jgi:hypothetical protein